MVRHHGRASSPSILHATGEQSGVAYSTQAWGAIIAPFIVGLIADRYFHAERLLGIIHIVCGVLMLMLARAHDFAQFYPYLLAYMILYMPTLALVNAISFRQMDVPARDFPKVRVWGTIGWIVAGLVISYVFRWDAPAALGARRAAEHLHDVRGELLPAGRLQLHAAAHPAARRWAARAEPGKRARPRCAAECCASATSRSSSSPRSSSACRSPSTIRTPISS